MSASWPDGELEFGCRTSTEVGAASRNQGGTDHQNVTEIPAGFGVCWHDKLKRDMSCLMYREPHWGVRDMDPGWRDRSATTARQTLYAHADRFVLSASVGDLYRRERVALAGVRHGCQANRVLLDANPNARIRALGKARKNYQAGQPE